MNIGFIGVGNMASAIISGLIHEMNPENIHIMNRTKTKALPFKQYGVNVYDQAQEVIKASDVIVLAIKPNQYEAWLKQHDIGSKTLVSIAAGINSEFLSMYVQKFVITMPNTPAAVKKGTTLIVNNQWVNQDILTIFNAIGTTKIIDEMNLEKYMMVTGCSPAYYFSFVDHLATELSTKFNFEKTETESLLIDVLEGSLAMLKQQESASKLCDNVCSPNGVTVQVIDALNQDLPTTLNRGFSSAIKRNQELK